METCVTLDVIDFQTKIIQMVMYDKLNVRNM